MEHNAGQQVDENGIIGEAPIDGNEPIALAVKDMVSLHAQTDSEI